MINKVLGLLLACTLLAACGYKGDLYLPRENDKARFGVIQTGIDLRQPDGAKQKKNNQRQDASAASTAERTE